MSWKWLNTLPNTQATLAAGVFLALLTGFVMVVSVVAVAIAGPTPAEMTPVVPWEPPDAWLWFVGGLITVGTGGVLGKRMTDEDYLKAKMGKDTVTTTTTTTASTGLPPETENLPPTQPGTGA